MHGIPCGLVLVCQWLTWHLEIWSIHSKRPNKLSCVCAPSIVRLVEARQRRYALACWWQQWYGVTKWKTANLHLSCRSELKGKIHSVQSPKIGVFTFTNSALWIFWSELIWWTWLKSKPEGSCATFASVSLSSQGRLSNGIHKVAPESSECCIAPLSRDALSLWKVTFTTLQCSNGPKQKPRVSIFPQAMLKIFHLRFTVHK